MELDVVSVRLGVVRVLVVLRTLPTKVAWDAAAPWRARGI